MSKKRGRVDPRALRRDLEVARTPERRYREVLALTVTYTAIGLAGAWVLLVHNFRR